MIGDLDRIGLIEIIVDSTHPPLPISTTTPLIQLEWEYQQLNRLEGIVGLGNEMVMECQEVRNVLWGMNGRGQWWIDFVFWNPAA